MANKLLLIAFLFFAGTRLTVQTTHSIDKAAVHGMLIFGTKTLYASHLPMFHSPHDYQVILEIELDSDTKQTLISDAKKSHGHVSYMIEPERFVLPNMVKNPIPFKANVYRGHFERGGIKIATNTVVTIKKLIYFKPFKHIGSRFNNLQYLVFGNEDEQFAAHIISSAPDFDHVMQVEIDLGKRLSDTLVFNPKANVLPNVSGNTILVSKGKNTPRSITLLKQLYLEFDDLK